MDSYFTNQELKYKGYDSLFCCLGSQTKHGDATFIKVDKTYPLLAADIAVSNRMVFFIQKYLIIFWFHQWEVIQKVGFCIQGQKEKLKMS